MKAFKDFLTVVLTFLFCAVVVAGLVWLLCLIASGIMRIIGWA